MLKCLIIDDEPIAQNIIRGYLDDTPGLVLMGICDNAIEAIEILENKEVDIIFLDIEMPKLSGLAFLKTLEKTPETIITTAYREFAVEGFELSVADYLLKPYSFERFLKAVNKVKKRIEAEKSLGTGSNVAEQTYTYFKSGRKNVKVMYSDIVFIEGLSNYVKIHQVDDKILVVYERLSHLQKVLPYQRFVRIHKSYIISLEKIIKYGVDSVEVGEKELTIGKSYKERFLSKIKNFNP
ncbi:LytTR family DNA-binding domain-containing protein [Muricauda sp. MAR_2010_75]|jgi:DNA-binding LytR/AlgR family response regulator|uniref:LytR/AlgR family response regulator transcription factor n=1 Tax=Allomuricauda sp. MAR_2010_75 TaxID=1250232 RepID=UPI000562B8CC|nr:LytTR family DNA-binding domain-containing protein [Muricauda sp. MAR_2010_75]